MAKGIFVCTNQGRARSSYNITKVLKERVHHMITRSSNKNNHY